VTDRVLDGWRDAKHYASAALASGKLVLMEQRIKKLEEDRAKQKQLQMEEKSRRQEKRRADKGNVKRIQNIGEEEGATLFASNIGELPGEDENLYGDFGDDDHIVHNIGAFSDDDDDDDEFIHFFHDDEDGEDDGEEHDELEQELQHVQHQKTYSALLSAIQMEALWKITKIELDRTIREACRWILEPTTTMLGDHRRRPPPPPHSGRHHRHQQQYNNHHHGHSRRRPQPPDGWVGTTGDVVPMEVGRLRAAAAMILVGDIMIQCSKEGTAWNK